LALKAVLHASLLSVAGDWKPLSDEGKALARALERL
jgi:hypothetical protein